MKILQVAVILTSLPGLLAWTAAPAQTGPAAESKDQAQTTDITNVSLEALAETPISASSFGRKDEELWKTPAAIFVITREDIDRSAASSIPDLLRLVPGVQVAQIDASTWSVSIRGFNSVYSNKLLVLVDGRTVYSEIAAGVHWDEIDLPLDVIERVEVVRGPGAAVWGTNAVNGVINIITTRAAVASGVLISANVSGVSQAGAAGYGGSLGQRAQYRGYASFVNRRPLVDSSGRAAFDGQRAFRVGGRLDWQAGLSDSLSVSEYSYFGSMHQQVRTDFLIGLPNENQEDQSLSGGFAVARWEHKSSRSDSALQVYNDTHNRHELNSLDGSNTTDVDFQNHRRIGSRNDIVAGGEFRFTHDSISGFSYLITLPHYNSFLEDAFFQDEITIVPQHLLLTLGTKIETGTLAGFQVQPSARILWAPSGRQTFWAAASRAIVSPAIEDKDVSVPISLGSISQLPIIGFLVGDPNLMPETLAAYEFGYRRRLRKSLTLDIASFVNRYNKLQSLAAGDSTVQYAPSPHIETALSYSNGFKMISAGVEASLDWKPRPQFAMQAGYAWMQAQPTQTVAGLQVLLDSFNGPRNNLSVTASWSFRPQWSTSTFVSHVSGLPTVNLLASGLNQYAAVPGYTRVDFNLSRKLGSALELQAGGTNLLSARHPEFDHGASFSEPANVQRSAFLRGAWTF